MNASLLLSEASKDPMALPFGFEASKARTRNPIKYLKRLNNQILITIGKLIDPKYVTNFFLIFYL